MFVADDGGIDLGPEQRIREELRTRVGLAQVAERPRVEVQAGIELEHRGRPVGPERVEFAGEVIRREGGLRIGARPPFAEAARQGAAAIGLRDRRRRPSASGRAGTARRSCRAPSRHGAPCGSRLWTPAGRVRPGTRLNVWWVISGRPAISREDRFALPPRRWRRDRRRPPHRVRDRTRRTGRTGRRRRWRPRGAAAGARGRTATRQGVDHT